MLSRIAVQAARAWRGEKRLILLTTFIIAASTAVLTFVLMLAHSFEKTLDESATMLLGGDIEVRLSARPFTDDEREWLHANAAQLSEIRVARVLAVANERAQIVRLKAVDDAYPLVGEIVANDGQPLALHGNRAYIGRNLVPLLNVAVGDTLAAGGLTLTIAGVVEQEPDPNLRFWANAPPLFVAREVVDAHHANHPELLMSHFIRLLLPANADADAWIARLNTTFPDAGWRVQKPESERNRTQNIIERIQRFLALVSLAGILLSAIGCSSALSAFLQAKMRDIAVMKMVGANQQLIAWIFVFLSALFVVVGVAVGTAVGLFAIVQAIPLLATYLPFTVAVEWSGAIFVRVVLTVVIISMAFVLPPILRMSRINPMTLFVAGAHLDLAPPLPWQHQVGAAGIFAIAIATLPLDWHSKYMVGIFLLVAIVLYGSALVLFALVRRAISHRYPCVRLGLLAIVRNRRQSASAVMSLGVGIFVIIAVMNTESNFYARLDDTLKQEAPALFFIGAQESQLGALQDIVAEQQGTLRTVPTLRGRITAFNARPVHTFDPPEEEAWVVRGDRSFTWTTSGDYIGASRIVAGQLWDPNVDGLQVSFDDEAAIAFGMGVGDTMELNILGESVTAVITSLRSIDWESFDVNFVAILNAPPFAGVPHTHMGGIYLPERAVTPTQLTMSSAFPNILPIAMDNVFSAIRNLLERAVALIQSSALFLLLSGLPMVFATLVEHRRRREQHATILRLLGASRTAILKVGLVEFVVTALFAIIPATLFGLAAGWLIINFIFELDWALYGTTVAVVATLGVLFYLAVGATDIIRMATNPPYPQLRNE